MDEPRRLNSQETPAQKAAVPLCPAVRIGPAGWGFKDWEGIVFPAQCRYELHPVEFLAGYFDTVEINSSFHGHIRPEIALLWCRKARAANRGFLFSAKLHRAFTHAREPNDPANSRTIQPHHDDEALAKTGLEVLAAQGMLGALVAQFPPSFKNTNENRDYLDQLLDAFHGYPVVVEVRHAGWNLRGVLDYYRRRGVVFCNLVPSTENSNCPRPPLGYVRLYGLSPKSWLLENAVAEPSQIHESNLRYLYDQGDLHKWGALVEASAAMAQSTFAITNNHFEGRSLVSALQLRHLLSGEPVCVPPRLLAHYAELQAIAAR